MPRKTRVESRTAIYHVIMRGNNREFIFKYMSLKKRFMKHLSECQRRAIFDRIAG
jgi:REP element-mobilizing transposase RayT